MSNVTAQVSNATTVDRIAIADACALLFYCLLAIAFTWPAVIDINHVVIGSGGDELGAIWWLWGRINGHIDVWGCTQLINWPEGVCHPSASQPLIEWPLLAFTAIANEVAGYTFFILVALVISATTGYLLLRRRGLSRLAASWGGAAMGFAPPILLQASTGHLAYVLSAPALLALHYAEHWWQARSVSQENAAFKLVDIKLGLALALTFWGSIYTGYFLSVAVFAMVIAAISLRLLKVEAATSEPHGFGIPRLDGKYQEEAIASRAAEQESNRTSHGSLANQRNTNPTGIGSSLRETLPLLMGGLVAIVIAAVALFAANWVLLCQHFGWLPDHVQAQGSAFFSRHYEELSVWGARPWDYFRASTSHPLWGALLNLPQRISIHGSNIFESSLWPGLLTVVLSVIALRKKPKVEIAPRWHSTHRGFVVRCAVAACFFAILSLPPTIDLILFELPTLSYFLYPFAPMFRVYSRAGIYVAVLLSAMSAVGLAYVLQAVLHSKSRTRLASATLSTSLFICLTLGVLELLPAVPGQVFAAVPRPAWMGQISTDSKPAAIALVPWWSDDDTHHYQYLFWQRLHSIPIVNGQRVTQANVAASSATASATYEAASERASSEGKSIITVRDSEWAARRHTSLLRWQMTDSQTQPSIEHSNIPRALTSGAAGLPWRPE